jgi:L,D-transpeptidase catalytic domain
MNLLLVKFGLRQPSPVRLFRGGRRGGLLAPTGTYFTVELLKQSDPRGPSGPYAFGLSACSNVLYSFGGGAGAIGLHGTDEPGKLGTDVSHGCIRVSDSVITRLAGVLPLETPVDHHAVGGGRGVRG